MKLKKFLLVLFFYLSTFSNSYPIEPDVFVQSTVNRASSILSKEISKEELVKITTSNFNNLFLFNF